MSLRRREIFSLAPALAYAAPTLILPKRLRLGLIGADGHPNEILTPLPAISGIDLVAFAEANSDPKAIASTLQNPLLANARRYKSVADLLAKEQLDIVAVCNNDGERAEAILSCLEKNLPTIAEKPFATKDTDFQRVVRTAESRRLPLGMLLPMRFDPQFQAMRTVVRSGEIGEILQIDAQKSYQLDNRPHWQKTASLYGSTILWIGPHMVDLMLYTSGRDFRRVISRQTRVKFPEIGDMQNISNSLFELDNGGMATLRMDYLRPAKAGGHGDDRLRLAGTQGIVEYQEATGVMVLSSGAPPRRLADLPPAGSVFEDFVASVFLKKKPALSWGEIVRVNQVTLRAHEASESGTFVTIAGLTR